MSGEEVGGLSGGEMGVRDVKAVVVRRISEAHKKRRIMN